MAVSADTFATITNLIASPRTRSVSLNVEYDDPHEPNGLPYLITDVIEYHASQTNDRSTATLVAEGFSAAMHDLIVEGETWFYWARPRRKAFDGSGTAIYSYGDFYPTSPTDGVKCTVGFASGTVMRNGKLVATADAGALTVSVKTTSGDDPSAANPVFASFYNSDGTYSTLSIEAACSVTLPSGASMGTTSNVACRLWAALFNQSGEARLALRNCFDVRPSPIGEFGVDDAELADTGRDFADEFVSSVEINDASYRVVGHLDFNSGLASAGVWIAPNVVQLFGPGVFLPGQVVNRLDSETGNTTSTGTTTIPFDTTKPEDSEGNRMSLSSITPKSPCNVLRVSAKLFCSYSVASIIVGALFLRGETPAKAVGWEYAPAADIPVQIDIGPHFERVSTASAINIETRVGGASAGTLYKGFQTSAGNKFDETSSSFTGHITIEELQG